MEIAITRALSVTDIGFRSTSKPSQQAEQEQEPSDQPVASAIGIRGTAASRRERRTASSTRNTAASAASSVRFRRHGDESAPFASAASTGSPTTDASTPLGGSSRRLMSSTTSFWRSSGISRMPKAMFAVLRSRETTPCEK